MADAASTRRRSRVGDEDLTRGVHASVGASGSARRRGLSAETGRVAGLARGNENWAEQIRPKAEMEILIRFSILENTENSNKQNKLANELRKILENISEHKESK